MTTKSSGKAPAHPKRGGPCLPIQVQYGYTGVQVQVFRLELVPLQLNYGLFCRDRCKTGGQAGACALKILNMNAI